jgi:hypothetical protein
MSAQTAWRAVGCLGGFRDGAYPDCAGDSGDAPLRRIGSAICGWQGGRKRRTSGTASSRKTLARSRQHLKNAAILAPKRLLECWLLKLRRRAADCRFFNGGVAAARMLPQCSACHTAIDWLAQVACGTRFTAVFGAGIPRIARSRRSRLPPIHCRRFAAAFEIPAAKARNTPPSLTLRKVSKRHMTRRGTADRSGH